MTPEETALLNAVLRNPDDDAPRFAYADWCERQTDAPTKARAEFIRIQIEISRLTNEALDNGGAYSLRYRESKLLDAYRANWLATVNGLADDFVFYRGFVELASLSARDFLNKAVQLFAAAPVRHLDLENVTAAADELFASEHLKNIRSLRLDGCGLNDGHLQLLANSPNLSNLRWLSIKENRIGIGGAEALAASPHLKQLKFADFTGNPVDPCEQVGIDSGAVVATWMPDEGKNLESRFGFIQWLHRDGKTLSDYFPSRFRL